MLFRSRTRIGMNSLQQAIADAPGDLAVLRIVTDGMIEAGRTEDARQAINRARFLCSEHRELDRLEQRVKFESARRRQRKTQDATSATDGGFTSLPFLRIAGGMVRRDAQRKASCLPTVV